MDNYNQSRIKFQQSYYNILMPVIKEMESKRKLYLLLAILSSSFIVVIDMSLIFIITISILPIYEKIGLIIVMLIFLSFANCAFVSQEKSFEKKIKPLIMPVACNCIGNIKWYLNDVEKPVFTMYSSDTYKPPEKLEGANLYVNSSLIPAFTKSHYEDCFSGEHNGVKYKIKEVEYSIHVNYVKSSQKVSVFKGIIIEIDMNKRFDGCTLVRQKDIIHGGDSCPPKLKEIILEDVNFAKKFYVYAEDEVEARYLLTTAFMERINNIKLAFNARKIDFVFYDNRLVFAIHAQKDLFSIASLLKPVNNTKQFFTMFEQILSIIKLIDYFKLDQRLGL